MLSHSLLSRAALATAAFALVSCGKADTAPYFTCLFG